MKLRENLFSLSQKAFSKCYEWAIEEEINPSKKNKLKKYFGAVLGAFSYPTYLSMLKEVVNETKQALKIIESGNTSVLGEIDNISLFDILPNTKTFKEIEKKTYNSLLQKGYSSERLEKVLRIP